MSRAGLKLARLAAVQMAAISSIYDPLGDMLTPAPPPESEDVKAERLKRYHEMRERVRLAREAEEADRVKREQHHIDRAAAKRARRAERNRRIAALHPPGNRDE